jgi:GT2 family glycosyltransferase
MLEALGYLRQQMPEARVTVLAQPGTGDSLVRCGAADEVAEADVRGTYGFALDLRVILRLRRQRFDLAIVPGEPHERAMMFALLSGASRSALLARGPGGTWEMDFSAARLSAQIRRIGRGVLLRLARIAVPALMLGVFAVQFACVGVGQFLLRALARRTSPRKKGLPELIMNPPLVSVVMLNCNGSKIMDIIRQSVQSISGQSYPNIEFFVVDDASTDDSVEKLSELAREYPKMRLICSRRRLGIPGARNLAVRASRGRYLAFLDNDAIPSVDWVEKTVAVVEANPRVADCASLLVAMDNPQIINAIGSVVGPLGYGCNIGANRRRSGFRAPVNVQYAMGAAMVVRREALDAIGWFDKWFLRYAHDDSDIGVRLWDSGWEVVTVPEAVVRHVHSYTKRSLRLQFYDLRNSVRFVFKHYSLRELLGWLRLKLRETRLMPDGGLTFLKTFISNFRGFHTIVLHRARAAHLPPYAQRFARFVQGEYSYATPPVPPATGPAQPLEKLMVGENDEAFLDEGWYADERDPTSGEAWRWATGEAALRFLLAERKSSLRLRFMMPRALAGETVEVVLARVGGGRFSLAIEGPPGDAGPGICHVIFAAQNLSLEAGEYEMVFRCSRVWTTPDVYPRPVSVGLQQLEFS